MRRGPAACASGLVCLFLVGCGAPAPHAVEQAQIDLGARGATVVHRDLARLVDRLYATAADATDALEAASSDTGGVFDALEVLRQRHQIDGLVWEGPGAEAAWAGRPLDALPNPPPPAWRGSFRQGSFAYHHGPFLRALVLGPLSVRGGDLTLTAILEERPAGVGPSRPFVRTWLDPLGLEYVSITSPEAAADAPEIAQSFLVHAPDGVPLLQVVVVPPGERAVTDRLAQRRKTACGAILLVLWLAATIGLLTLVWRRVRGGPLRWIALGAVSLLARTLLVALDLPDRFPFLEPAFRPSDFGIEDPLGFLASPGDFALSAIAILVAAACFGAAVRGFAPPRRRVGIWVARLAGVGCAAAAPALWTTVVELAVAQGQIEFFDVPSLVPTLPAALLLTGLVAATAAAWALTAATLRLATRAAPARIPFPASLGMVLAAAAGAYLLARGSGAAWAAAALPVAAMPVVIARPGVRDTAAAPSRILLVGVLATLLLFPLLWIRVGERRALTLAATLDDLLRAEAAAVSGTYLDLTNLDGDPVVRRALDEARRGPVPEGLALDVWLRSFLAQPDARGLVSILGPRGNRLDDFTLTPLPRNRIPTPAPPAAGAEDLQVTVARGAAGGVQCVVGRLRLRDEEGEPLGSVVFTVPAPVDLALAGIEPEGVAALEEGSPGRAARAQYQYAVVERGRVVASSDPSISRRRGSFGPPILAELGPDEEDRTELTWREGGYEGYALWSWDRGAVIAIRREAAGIADAVLAMARLVTVGAGLAGLAAVAALLLGLRRLKPRLHHRILLSYFAISVIPLVLLAWASARDARARHDGYLSERLGTDIRRARTDLEAMGPQVFDRASDARLLRWADQRKHDVFLYRDGVLFATSRAGLVESETLPARLPADAYRATVREHRELVRREATFAGRPVWFAYAPILEASGQTRATVGVPLLYEQDRVDERFAVTGSVLLAGYLLTLVLVLVGGIYAARRLAQPLSELASGTRRVAAGELDIELAGGGPDELGELVDAFNTMTRELEAATARAVRAEREMAWQRMARQVAHEIKNPLTPMRLMIQQMEADVARDPARAEAAIRRTAPVVLKQIETLSRIASDFAHFARMPRRNLGAVDLAALTEDVIGLYAGSAGTGVEVSWAGEPPVALPPLRGDAEELRRVLVNLVGNAVEAIDGEGRVDLTARPARRGEAAGIELEVTDTGGGIRPEHRERIFEPDFSTKTSGTGLGLAIVRRAVDDMGGTIEVESAPGRGSTFRLWLPATEIPPA